jgi:hypothetical protein
VNIPDTLEPLVIRLVRYELAEKTHQAHLIARTYGDAHPNARAATAALGRARELAEAVGLRPKS